VDGRGIDQASESSQWTITDVGGRPRPTLQGSRPVRSGPAACRQPANLTHPYRLRQLGPSKEARIRHRPANVYSRSVATPEASSEICAELLRLAVEPVEDLDVDRMWDLVQVLQERSQPEVVDWALPKLTSTRPGDRVMASVVLGQHGCPQGRPYGDRVAPALAAAARIEHDDEVRAYLVGALGHAEDPAWAFELASYANDPYPPVREAVAASLPIMFRGEEPDDAALAVLITLSADPDPQVRDWATMGLGSQCTRDEDALRNALRARLDDSDEDGTATSGEAALGLALRHDSYVFDYLDRWLAASVDKIGNLIVEAAGELGDQRLLPRLLELRDAGWQADDPRPGVLDDAIAAFE